MDAPPWRPYKFVKLVSRSKILIMACTGVWPVAPTNEVFAGKMEFINQAKRSIWDLLFLLGFGMDLITARSGNRLVAATHPAIQRTETHHYTD